MIHADKKLDAWIEVSDDAGTAWSAAPEYSTVIKEDNAKTYIEAKTGQCFRFRLSGLSAEPTANEIFRVHYFCDGNEVADRIFGAYEDTWPLEGLDASETTVVPFKFGALQTTDQVKNACADEMTETLGELRMDIWRVEFGEDPNVIPVDFEKAAPERNTFLEHRVKKKSNHQVVYEEEKVAMAQLGAVVAYKLDEVPFLSFHFRYLSEALLDLKGIRPFEAEASHDPNEAPQAGPSNPRHGQASGSSNGEEGGSKKRQREASKTVDTEEYEALKAENRKLNLELARLRKKAKVEEEDKVDFTED